jgi:hypothetical protein
MILRNIKQKDREMNKKELFDSLSDVPDNAEIYVEADHGQNPERCPVLLFTADEELPNYGEDIAWLKTMKPEKATAVLLSTFQ